MKEKKKLEKKVAPFPTQRTLAQPQRALLTSLDGKHGCLPKIVQIYRNATPRQPRRYIGSEKLGQSKSQSLGGTLRYREKPLANK